MCTHTHTHTHEGDEMVRERKWKREEGERGGNEKARKCKTERRKRRGKKAMNGRGVRRKHGKTRCNWDEERGRQGGYHET